MLKKNDKTIFYILIGILISIVITFIIQYINRNNVQKENFICYPKSTIENFADKNCESIGAWKGNEQMTAWCNTSCNWNPPNCPTDMCKCNGNTPSAPTPNPSAPTPNPSAPTPAPTGAPTNAPTGAPTNAPTGAPTNAPTGAPTNAPTNTPSAQPQPAGTFPKGLITYMYMPSGVNQAPEIGLEVDWSTASGKPFVNPQNENLVKIMKISSVIIISFPNDTSTGDWGTNKKPFDENTFATQYITMAKFLKENFKGKVLFSLGGNSDDGNRGSNAALHSLKNVNSPEEMINQLENNKYFDGVDLDIEPEKVGDFNDTEINAILNKIDLKKVKETLGNKKLITCATLGYYDNHKTLNDLYVKANLDNYGIMVYPGETMCDSGDLCNEKDIDEIFNKWKSVGSNVNGKLSAGLIFDSKVIDKLTDYLDEYKKINIDKVIIWAVGPESGVNSNDQKAGLGKLENVTFP